MAKVNIKKGNIEEISLGTQIHVRALQRISQDISSWRNAIRSAENVQNPRRTLLYTLYEEITLDGHLTSVIEKRKDAILNTSIEWVQPSGQVDKRISLMLESPWFYDMLDAMMDARFWGYSLIELLPEEGEVGKADQVNRFHVRPETHEVVINPQDTSGIKFTEPPYNYFCFGVGKEKDFGLLLQAAQYVIYKRGGFGNWADFSQIFGHPFREARYNGHDDVTRRQLESMLEEMGSAAYAVIPEGSELKFHTNNQGATGSKDLYSGLIAACNAEISKLILGNTLTTEQGDNGARSLGEVHQGVEDSKNRKDRQWIENELNWTVKYILRDTFGYPLHDDGRFRFDTSESLDKQLERDIKLSQAVVIDPDYWEQKYNVPVLGLKNQGGMGELQPGS